MLAVTQDSAEQDRRLASAFEAEGPRLLAFIRRRIPKGMDAEDLLQDVFYELVEAYRLMKPIAHSGAWMMQIAKNRIIDMFRSSNKGAADEASGRVLEHWLPSRDAGPDALYARSILVAEIEAALGELPPRQREVFLAHEIEGRSFAEISKDSGLSINTLLSRKHYAVKRLRSRLQRIYREAGYERRMK